MIRTKIKIGSGGEVDTYDTYRMIYLSSDHYFGAPIKEMETTSYPEEDGVHVYDKVAYDTFDYKVVFLVEGATLSDVNTNISAFNAAIVNATTHALSQITLFNTYKKVKIVGYPQPISAATDFWRDKYGNYADAAQVELTIKVTNPSLCDFNYNGSSNTSENA